MKKIEEMKIEEVKNDVKEVKTTKTSKTSKKVEVKNMDEFKTTNHVIKFNFDEKRIDVDGKEQVVKSKSDMFRIMYNNEMEVCEIAKVSKSHYSFVYEVISKTNGEVRNVVKESKSNVFRELYDKGMTVGMIAKQTNSNYSFVHTCIKKYKESKNVK